LKDGLEAMTCDEANTFIEAVAMGDTVAEELAAHLAGCGQCAPRLALARRIDLTLKERVVPAASPGFTGSVMARLRRDRWRTEQVVDLSFNIAVATGVLLVLGGIAGFAWRAGAFAIGGDIAALMVSATRTVVTRAAMDLQVITAIMLLISTAFGLWWWSEEGTV
jgi:anti-sigma factor RsiW